jgi:membrane protein implicated in regulation of membrane protease activity
MFPSNPLVQLYMVSTVVGWGFICVSMLLGQAGDHDHDSCDGVLDTQHNLEAHHYHGHHSDHQDAHLQKTGRDIYFTLLSAVSPYNLSLFVGFFGLGGCISLFLFPAIQWLTLAIAIPTGIIGMSTVRFCMQKMGERLSVSLTTTDAQAIGAIGEISTPISQGKTGEITYLIGNTRFNAAARSIEPGKTFARGARVVIVQNDGPYVMVQAFEEN